MTLRKGLSRAGEVEKGCRGVSVGKEEEDILILATIKISF